MLRTGSPLEDERRAPRLSPGTGSHNASMSSTPGISSLDGTPRYLCSPPPPPRPLSLPLPEMAIKPAYLLEPGHQGQHGEIDFCRASAGKVLHPVASWSQHSSQYPSAPQELTKDHAKAVSLCEISRILRLQKYHKRRCHRSQENLHYLQIAAARTYRLTYAAHAVQHTLAECIKSEDKNSFANLLHAFHDASNDCLRPTHPNTQDGEPASGTDPRPTSSFLDDISSSSRDFILDFLTKIRYDSAFLADRLGSLNQKELLALLPDRALSRANDSVFGGSTRSSSRTSRPLGFVVDAQVDLLSSYAYGIPLETLVFVTRGVSNASPFEDELATDVWATVCAKMIAEQKSGSEKLVPAILDIWASLCPWPGKDRLEVWILQTLQRGSFLLEPNRPTFRARAEGRPDQSVDDELRVEAFYSQAADSLLELMGDTTGPSVIPPGALKMSRAIADKLSSSPSHQRGFPRFVAVRWLFSTFCLDALTLPEAHGMLTDHYVSDIARQRILREAILRAQKYVFDVSYSWKHGTKVSPEVFQRVHGVMAKLQAVSPNSSNAELAARSNKLVSVNNLEAFLAVSAKDVIISINALYPQRRPPSMSSDYDHMKTGLQSSASSMSGFSLFRNGKTGDAPFEGLSPLSQEPQSCGSLDASIRSLQMNIEDETSETQMRDVYLELEDLATSQTTSHRELWDVLIASAYLSPLSLMREKSLQACGRQDRPTETQGGRAGVEFPKSDSQERSSLTKLVGLVLLEDSSWSLLEDLALSPDVPEDLTSTWASLESLFEHAIQECETRLDFVNAHCWFQRLQDLRFYVFKTQDMSGLCEILHDVEQSARRTTLRALNLDTACESWMRFLRPALQLSTEFVTPVMEANGRLRDKMWYVSDVRTSAPYDEIRSISSALRVMGKSKGMPRTRLAPPLRHWSGPKLSSTSLHLKTEAQILEILSTGPDHGGPNKLSDDQSKAVEFWMDSQNIDNLCRGEERIHKLCMEVRKCVDLITASAPSETSIIWSNTLFSRDRAFRQQSTSLKKPALLSSLYGCTGPPSFLSLQTHLRSTDALSSASRTLSSASSRDYLDTRSPTLTNKSSIPFWSPAMTEIDSPSSATSIGSSLTQSALESLPQKQESTLTTVAQSSLDKLRQQLTSFVLSDLTSVLFSDGSETDRAFWTGLGWDMTDRHFRSLNAFHSSIDSIGSQTPTMESCLPLRPSMTRFSFDGAFSCILERFSATSNPTRKLDLLYDIDRLLVPYMAEQNVLESPPASSGRTAYEQSTIIHERRVQDPTEISVRGFQNIFSKKSLRPSTIFRDLQYIAALLPSSVLQTSPQGKAFCNAAVAITSLKQEARTVMVETADSIIAYHSNNRGHGRTSSTAQQQRDFATFSAPNRTPSAEDVARYSMADAAYLLQITAKEGDPVAQRELATLYLTHPELMDRIIAPFARPKDVFKEELESKWRKNQDPNRCDPVTMCVAHHWMSLSSKGGDSLAKEYLRQREEMDSF